jgi:glycerol-3-phosphate O-acyltransferase/dihydroxyacetone phosphate acyltransferase
MRILGAIFYNYLWVVFNIFLGYFYRANRRKNTYGLENVPKDRPVIFCSNHPNAFMDALMLGSTIRRRTWFLARSDVFRKKTLAKFLTFVGIIPIYRLLEGAENLSKNDETFDKCSAMLAENKAIMVFSEGLCIQERRLRKLKKGTARIALGTEEKNNFNLNLTIVPVGMNYSATPWKFRKSLHVRFGTPYLVKDYEALYKENPAKAMNQFTRDLEEKMKSLLVIIDDKANDELVGELEEMFLMEWAKEEYRDPRSQTETHHVTKEITHLLKECEKENPNEVIALREKIAEYFKKVKSINTRDWVIRKMESGKLGWGGVIFRYLLYVLFLPISIFGIITNYVPYKVPYLIANKIVKHIEWHASVNATIGIFLWQFYWLLQSLVVALVFRNWYILGAFMILVPVCGVLAEKFWILLRKTTGEARMLLMKNKSGVVEEIFKTRNEISKEVYALKERFPLKEVD